jgi:hypothetical protein
MGIIVDLPAPSCKGTYFVLVEPNVVKVTSSSCITKGLINIKRGTFRSVALLAWTKASKSYVHELLKADQITLGREFFRISRDGLDLINRCRESLGFQRVEEILLWEFGGPLPYEYSGEKAALRGKRVSRISSEESSRRGRYYTHLRWHKNKPKPSCEFCIKSVNHR